MRMFEIIGAFSAAAALVACPPLDALDPAGGDAASADRSTEGGSDAAAERAGDASNAAVDASDAEEASHGGAQSCLHVIPPDAGGTTPACDVPDGSVCAPSSIAGYVPRWTPPAPARAACTQSQIQEYLDACYYTATASHAVCDDFKTNNGSCAICLESKPDAPTLGPFVSYADGDLIFPNPGGCILLLEPCNEDCAAAMLALDECAASSCSACFSSGTQASMQCADLADTCTCENYATAYVGCIGGILQNGGAASACFDSNAWPNVPAIATAFCGGAT